MKIKDKGMNISFCCGTMGSKFLAGIFRLEVDKRSLYFYTTANIKVYFCPFCGTEIEFDPRESNHSHQGPAPH